MSAEVRAIVFGLSCGLTAGFAPGPLLALVISQTLKYNFREGLKVAIAPALTDLPIVAIALLILSRIGGLDSILGVISLIGAGVVLSMAIGNLKVKALVVGQPGAAPKSILQGMATNFFQPHPHIFWFGVGAPAMLAAWKESHLAAVAFLITFLLAIVVSKVAVALLVKQSQGHLPDASYRWVLRGLGTVMLGFAVILARDGFRYLGVL